MGTRPTSRRPRTGSRRFRDVGAGRFVTTPVRVRAQSARGPRTGRAERDEATLTFPAQAVVHQRTVSGRPMRTVIVRDDGLGRYVHLLFSEEPVARRLLAGPVQLDLFGGPKVQGPARLTLPNGDVVWA